jgi:hypothetical protein
MPLTRTPENPIVDADGVKVAVIDDTGKQLIVRIMRQALEEADQAFYSDDELIAAADRHWPAASAVAERKRSNAEFDGENQIGVYSADLVPPEARAWDDT